MSISPRLVRPRAGVDGLHADAGDTVTINPEPATRAETDRLFAALGKGGKVDTPLQATFWGGYFGILIDQFRDPLDVNCASAT